MCDCVKNAIVFLAVLLIVAHILAFQYFADHWHIFQEVSDGKYRVVSVGGGGGAYWVDLVPIERNHIDTHVIEQRSYNLLSLYLTSTDCTSKPVVIVSR